MIDVLTGADLRRRPETLKAMHRLRYRVFVERLRWSVTARAQMEVDTFDKPDAMYLLARDDNDEVVGTWRMLPTTGPYMLRDVFPRLLDGEEAPQDPAIWEGSRFAVDCRGLLKQGLGTPSRVTGEIFCAVVEFGLALGLREVITVYDHRIARLLPRIGCHPKWQSSRHRIEQTIALAGRFDINQRALDDIMRANGLTGSVLRTAPWLRQRTAA